MIEKGTVNSIQLSRADLSYRPIISSDNKVKDRGAKAKVRRSVYRGRTPAKVKRDGKHGLIKQLSTSRPSFMGQIGIVKRGCTADRDASV